MTIGDIKAILNGTGGPLDVDGIALIRSRVLHSPHATVRDATAQTAPPGHTPIGAGPRVIERRLALARTVQSCRGHTSSFPAPAALWARASSSGVRVGRLRVAVTEWRRACGPRLGDLGGKAQVPQDALRHGRLVDQRDQPQPPTATRARQDVEAKRPAHQIGPTRARPVVGRLWRVHRSLSGSRSLLRATSARSRARPHRGRPQPR